MLLTWLILFNLYALEGYGAVYERDFRLKKLDLPLTTSGSVVGPSMTKTSGTSTKAFMKGVETCKKETIMKKEVAKQANLAGSVEIDYMPLPTGLGSAASMELKETRKEEIFMDI